MKRQIQTATLLKKGEIEIGPPPSDFNQTLGKNDVRIKVKSVGICGSDVHYWTEGKIGDFVVEKPMVLGHESSGIIIEIGEGVKDLQVGDRVAMEPGIPCRMCELCKTGRYNLCPDVRFLATPPVHGSLATEIIHPSDFCFKLPPTLSYEEGALLEPLSVGVHAIRRGQISLGKKVLITGAGTIGLVCLLIAKCSGAKSVSMLDLNEKRLNFAKELGADFVENPNNFNNNNNNNNLELFDVCIECSGAKSAIKTCLNSTKNGGTVVIVGMNSENEISIPLIQTAAKEIDIRGVFRYANAYQTALELLISGKLNSSKKLITHTYPFNQTLKAFETAKNMTDGKTDAVKVILKLNEED